MEMEQKRFWPHFQTRLNRKSSSYDDDSWEEQAFAEDTASGRLGGGGCIWPPRSYSCSFCKREFRSAQALGGHMNVHRRDRARLKHESLNKPDVENHHRRISSKNIIPSLTSDFQPPSFDDQVIFINPNPNPNPNTKSSSSCCKRKRKEVLELSPNSMDDVELDLELRLGATGGKPKPKLK